MPSPARSGNPSRRTWGPGAIPGQRQTLARGTQRCIRQPLLLPPIVKPRGAVAKPESRKLSLSWPVTRVVAASTGKENFGPVSHQSQNWRKTSARNHPADSGKAAAKGPEWKAAGPGAVSGVGAESEPESEGSRSGDEDQLEARGRILDWLLEVNMCLFRETDHRCRPPTSRPEEDTSIKIVYQENRRTTEPR